MSRPDWDEYFLNIAKAVAERSTCLRRKYGAVIVKGNKIISTGYNGAARGEVNCDEKGECLREMLGIPSGERYELCLSVHAEANAIINGTPDEMDGATIYIYGTDAEGKRIQPAKPCMMCDRMIKNAKIARVVC
jgi:dCMP deaminase